MNREVLAIIERTLESLKASGALSLEALPAFTVEPPKQAAHGDCACNVAMVLAKPEKKPPRAIAEAIVRALVDPEGVVAKVEIAGPGFLNFTLTESAVQSTIREVLRSGTDWGRAESSTGKKVMVEYVSANPTGPVHIGHARGAFVGDAIARLLSAAGHDVTKEFYVNDFGRQVEILGRTVLKRYQQLHGAAVELAEGEYPGEYVIQIAEKLKAEDGARWLEADEQAALERCTALAVRENLESIRAALAQANVEHDVFFHESSLHVDGAVKDIVAAFRDRGATYEADQAQGTENKVRRDDSKSAQYADRQLGGTFLATSTRGDEEDRIIQRRDGTPVYLTADLAYHKRKFDRGFDRCVDVFGADHGGHVPRIRAAMRLLDIDDTRLDFVLVQMVRIVRDGQEVKLSKRSGTVYTLPDLIDEVGADACRFTFLMKSPNAQMDFDLTLATKAASDNPVYYFQYGHARCAQILAKAEATSKAFVGVEHLTDAMLAALTLPEERSLLKKMSLFPEVISRAAEGLEPHAVLYYCHDLIADFHSYYTKYKNTERVIGDDPVKTQGRLAFVAALKQTLMNAFAILGVSAPDRMDAVADGVE
jgi:arginyl-tRNA synthetase